MHEGGGCADISPSTSSLLALKPRQVLLVELQRNLAEAAAMERKRSENAAQLKSEEESVVICSVALWLENKGLLKVLKRFISATQIQVCTRINIWLYRFSKSLGRKMGQFGCRGCIFIKLHPNLIFFSNLRTAPARAVRTYVIACVYHAFKLARNTPLFMLCHVLEMKVI